VADALSRREWHNGELLCCKSEIQAVSEIFPQWVEDIKGSYLNDSWVQALQTKMKEARETNNPCKLTEHAGIIRYKGRICVGTNGNWREQILKELHDSSIGGHSGITTTYQRIKKHFYWPHLKEFVHTFVQHCSNCQLNKGEHTVPAGLLQPLPIPNEAWSSVGLDFITGLPKSKGLEVILVAVDRLTKYAHFIGLSHPFTASSVAQAFLR
jgi:Integrase zinc binding domain